MEAVLDATSPREVARLWHGVLGRLELELNPHMFSTWLKGTKAVAFVDDTLTVAARTVQSCDFLHVRLRMVVERAVSEAVGRCVSVAFVVAGMETSAGDERRVASGPPAVHPVIGTVNCQNTFEDYLTAKGNAMAVQACRDLVEPADVRITPVVLYGVPGVGKTHLLHALACRAQQAGRLVACLSAEEFSNRFVAANVQDRLGEFHAQFRGVDLLLIDDLQGIEPKVKTQDELVRTMDAVKHRGGHVVVASEQLPFELALHDRLASRLAEGIVTRIEPFAFEERREYIQRIARRRRTSLPAWAVDRIAARNVPSVRVLLGCINSALMLQREGQLELGRLDACIGAVALREAVSAPGDELLERVARYFSLAVDDLTGPSRRPAVARARAVAVASLNDAGRSLNNLAELFARDKSTLSGLAQRGRGLIEGDPALRETLAG